jgi:glucan phosphoethanolaminetransferase (alkaline phosphatase superfamily)
MLFVLIIAAVLSVYTFNKVTDALKEQGVSGEALEVTEKMNSSMDFLDYFFLMVFIGMFIAMIILAFMIRTHPALFIPYILLMVITIVVSVAISNAYYAFSLEETLASTISAKFPIADYLMRNLPLEIGIFGIVLLIIMYSKTQEGLPV